ncbi:DUF2268 domain-containing putative Zn-dependent protease [Pseudalkalibacillus hwajinpoensis]|nr:DUF2268 domain-containing putative Zn-dependent protease [Pseudalkalibacillus hwajinpoensis]
MEQYLNNINRNQDDNRTELFCNVFEVSSERLKFLLFLGMIDPKYDDDVLNIKLHKMKQLMFESYIQTELERLENKYQSNKIITFELFILDDHDKFVMDKLGGVSATTEWSGEMCFIVDTIEQVKPVLKSVIAHEFHHHLRIQRLNITEENETLLDRMVMEGMAEHFVKVELGEGYLGPYKDALSAEEIEYWNSKVKSHLFDKGTTTDAFMFGCQEQKIPFWCGYALGYFLVARYIATHPGLSIKTLTALPSSEFI